MNTALDHFAGACRLMAEIDLPVVLDIEKRSYQFPWTEGIFLDCMQHGNSSWVLETPQAVVGYGVMSIAVGECHILNLCIDPDCRGQGKGRYLLGQMLTFARSQEADTAFLEVRTTNFNALSLYFSEGFNEIGIRKNYYPCSVGRENAVILAKSL